MMYHIYHEAELSYVSTVFQKAEPAIRCIAGMSLYSGRV